MERGWTRHVGEGIVTPSVIPIPDGATGRQGMLVALFRVKGIEDGRLGIIKHPVGWVRELFDTPQDVFAWQVFLTGEPVAIHGHLSQEIMVPDQCLRLVSQLEPPQLRELMESHQQSEIDAAVARVHELVKPDEIDSPEFERLMHLALNKAILNRLKDVAGVEETLRDVGFWQSHPPDGESYEWRSVYQGQEIQMSAAPGMFGDWRIWSHSANEREIFGGERVMCNDWPRGKMIQTLLELWEDIFGRSRIPQPFEMGWLYRQHVRDMQAIEPVMPYIDLDGESFRRALRWLREAYRIEEGFVGPPPDSALQVEIRGGTVRLMTKDHSIGVTLRRGWLDPLRISLRSLLAIPPNALRGYGLHFSCNGAAAWIGGYELGQLRPW